MRKVAITGGLASGKSLACLFFGALGACVISSDEIVHQLLSNDSNVKKEVIDLLGRDVWDDEENLFNKGKIAEIVFGDLVLLKELEKILHPKVKAKLHNWQIQISLSSVPLLVVESPLLFEANMESFYDATIAILSDSDLCLNRFKLRGYSDVEFFKRTQRQLADLEKAKRADFVIENNDGFDDLKKRVIKMFYEESFYEY